MKQGPSFARKQGTVIALACAAAFALPQVAHAQKEGYEILKAEGHPLTLQGNVSIGYARSESKGGHTVAGVPVADQAETPQVWSGESNIRFSASSKLGGGFIEAIGFQVESGFETSDGTLSGSQGTLASRNSALGLKTTIGTFFGGKWDTPFKLAMGTFYLTASSNGFGASTTGFIGTPGMAGGSFSGTSPTSAIYTLGNNNVTPNTSVATTMNFRRRQANTLNYYTPQWNGFQAGFQYGPNEEGDIAAAGAPSAKPEMWSTTAGYYGNNFTVMAAYEKHEDYLWGSAVGTKLGTVAAGVGTNSSDHALSFGANYTWGPVLLSGYWERLSYSQSGGTAILRDIEGSNNYLGARWRIAGPHSIVLAYGKANGLSCDGTLAWQAGSKCAATGAQIYNFLYRYQLDKVSYFNVFYGKLNNDDNGNFQASNNAGATGNGHTDQGWSIGMQTSF